MSWYRAPLWDLRPDITSRRSELLYDWQSVSMSWYRAPLWDLDQILLPVGMLLWGALLYKNAIRNSQETYYASITEPNLLMLFRGKTAVYCEVRLLYDWQSVSMSWYRAPLWDLRPDIYLRSCIYLAPSLTRGRVCNLLCNHSIVRVAQNSKPYFTVSSETPPILEGKVPVFITPRNRVAQLYARALGS
jgi:hypothetical protein